MNSEGEKIGKVIARLRREKGWSQGQLAYHAGTTGSHISLMESGRRNNPGAILLARIAVALDTTPDYVLTEAGILTETEDTPFPPELRVLRDLINSYPEGRYKDEVRRTIISLAEAFHHVLKMLEEERGEVYVKEGDSSP